MMALFGLGKKKEEPLPQMSAGMPQIQGVPGYSEAPMDMDSGLKLDALNPQPQQFDSFGNQRRQPNYESEMRSVPVQQFQQPQQDMSKDLQIIMAKLDAIRAEVSTINHRLDSLERGIQQTQRKYSW